MAKGKREDLTKGGKGGGERGKIGGVYRSGSFKGKKAANLSKAQLKRATTARGKKVSQKAVKRATKPKNTANISDTQFVKGKGVMKGGKLFTGQVKLASGKTATYVRGRRVVAGPKKTGGGGGRGGGTSSSPRPTNSSGSRITNTTASRIGGYTPGTSTPRTSAATRKARGLRRASARAAGRTASRTLNTTGARKGDTKIVGGKKWIYNGSYWYEDRSR